MLHVYLPSSQHFPPYFSVQSHLPCFVIAPPFRQTLPHISVSSSVTDETLHLDNVSLSVHADSPLTFRYLTFIPPPHEALHEPQPSHSQREHSGLLLQSKLLLARRQGEKVTSTMYANDQIKIDIS